MVDRQHFSLDEVVPHFEELEDPRSAINRRHPLVSVVVIAMLAVLAGAGGPTGIAEWAALKEEFLLNTLDLPNGIPQGCLSSCADDATSGCVSSLFCKLVEFVACDSRRGDRCGSTRFCG